MKNSKLNFKPDINIYEYLSYRMYIDDYFTIFKQNDKKFSFKKLCEKIGISTNLIGLIIRGERNVSYTLINKIADALLLSGRRHKYFILLWKYNQSKDPYEADDYFTELIKIQKASGAYSLTPNEHEYYDKWYYQVVKEVVCWGNFNNDFKMLSKLIIPAITEAEAKTAVEVLLNLGLIAKKNGEYYATNLAISGENIPKHKKEVVRNDVMQLSQQSVNIFSSEERYTTLHTATVNEDDFREIQDIIQEAEQKIIALCSKDTIEIEENQNNRVYEIVFNAFPLTK